MLKILIENYYHIIELLDIIIKLYGISRDSTGIHGPMIALATQLTFKLPVTGHNNNLLDTLHIGINHPIVIRFHEL